MPPGAFRLQLLFVVLLGTVGIYTAQPGAALNHAIIVADKATTAAQAAAAAAAAAVATATRASRVGAAPGVPDLIARGGASTSAAPDAPAPALSYPDVAAGSKATAVSAPAAAPVTQAVPGLAVEQELSALQQCVNTQYKRQATSWDQAVDAETPPQLQLVKAWGSNRSSQGGLTVVTHASIKRLGQLAAQCASWSGPLAAAVYLPQVEADDKLLGADGAAAHQQGLEQQRNQVVGALDKLYARVEQQTGGCQLSMLLLREGFSSEGDTVLYPYNTLRNYALLLAMTPLVAMIDVDLMPSDSLFRVLMDPFRYAELRHVTRNGSCVVLPSFETLPQPGGLKAEIRAAAQSINGEKLDIQRQAQQKVLLPFHQIRYPPGHRGTNYSRWYSSSTFYPASYELYYEPWCILQRSLNPWYDVRYRGYFYDKAMHVAGLHYQQGAAFPVHPQAFLVHRPHPLTEALTHPRMPQLHVAMWKKHNEMLAEMKQGTYMPHLDPTFATCSLLLSWFPQLTVSAPRLSI